jgi:hypothetical protein
MFDLLKSTTFDVLKTFGSKMDRQALYREVARSMWHRGSQRGCVFAHSRNGHEVIDCLREEYFRTRHANGVNRSALKVMLARDWQSPLRKVA